MIFAADAKIEQETREGRERDALPVAAGLTSGRRGAREAAHFAASGAFAFHELLPLTAFFPSDAPAASPAGRLPEAAGLPAGRGGESSPAHFGQARKKGHLIYLLRGGQGPHTPTHLQPPGKRRVTGGEAGRQRLSGQPAATWPRERVSSASSPARTRTRPAPREASAAAAGLLPRGSYCGGRGGT